MTDEWISGFSIQTAMLLPVVTILATFLVSYVSSFFSIKRSIAILRSGLVIGVISMLVAWAFVAVNVLAK